MESDKKIDGSGFVEGKPKTEDNQLKSSEVSSSSPAPFRVGRRLARELEELGSDTVSFCSAGPALLRPFIGGLLQ